MKRNDRRLKKLRRRIQQCKMYRPSSLLQKTKVKAWNLLLLYHRSKGLRTALRHHLGIHLLLAGLKALRSILWVKLFSVCLICITVSKRSFNKAAHLKSNDQWMHLWSGRGYTAQQSPNVIRTRTTQRSALSSARFGTSYPRNNSSLTLMKLPAWKKSTEQNIQTGSINQGHQNDG